MSEPPARRKPVRSFGAITARMLSCIQAGRPADAIRLSAWILLKDPRCFEALRLAGTAYAMQSQYREATVLLQRALRLDSDNIEVISNLGVALHGSGELTQAIAMLRRAVSLKPTHRDALQNLSNVLHEAHEFDEALSVAEKLLQLDPSNPHVNYNMGNIHRDAGRPQLAISYYERALTVAPHIDEIRENLAYTLLQAGDFRRGWPAFEARPARRHQGLGVRSGAALWDGQRPVNGRLILVAEQGFGDTIQFSRYVKLLKERGLRLALECHRQLVKLMASTGYFEWVAPFENSPAGPDNLWFPLMSLPTLFATEIATIPQVIPFLKQDQDTIDRRGARLGSDRALRVGIAWQGNPQAEIKQQRHRSIPLAEFAPLAAIADVRLFCLQKGPGIEQLGGVGFASRIELPQPELDCFADTAALMMHLDLVITSDTAVAHLAGTLGRPVWVALNYTPDWRWLLGRDDSPWYPTMRLFRQPAPMNWAAVFETMSRELLQLRAARMTVN